MNFRHHGWAAVIVHAEKHSLSTVWTKVLHDLGIQRLEPMHIHKVAWMQREMHGGSYEPNDSRFRAGPCG
jgi:hypothetical protein